MTRRTGAVFVTIQLTIRLLIDVSDAEETWVTKCDVLACVLLQKNGLATIGMSNSNFQRIYFIIYHAPTLQVQCFRPIHQLDAIVFRCPADKIGGPIVINQQLPVVATFIPALKATHLVEYVFPSHPHTGLYSLVQEA